ncbi:hypothetical protein BvCmsKKNP021_01736 [Escherichia coli]|nr:hypothetical protein G931_04636 [Escherichia coli UMEA 3176-1]GCN84071.1 hypothetical protein BvCms2805_01531 [Escherichia coli]GDE85036.1 hypothetical protein BvCmsKKNP001_03244 [Escherichia coli]GDG12822.1 hypothetical protein BvCmsKKNP017_00364 [Escherichia coli]GDH67593.1 hypothetical protein BvCmsKKNP021_01736 [Escherichia coli]
MPLQTLVLAICNNVMMVRCEHEILKKNICHSFIISIP